ncbi:MAG TPA: class I SAM-dependent methyltransferase [Ferruginibacter sp.]|nr:class I SAM-dependent methyltransferase [Ferruginibacter sp.]
MTENIYNPEFVKSLFNRMSGSYERMNYITSFGFSIRWRKQFIKRFERTKNKIEIIDLLTGMGETWNAVKNMFPNAKLTGLDFSAEMLNSARKKSQQHFKNEVKLVQQDVLESNLPGNHFDIVICAFGLKTFNSDQIKILAIETRRILKSGGKFSFIEVSKPGNIILKALYKFYLGKIIPIFGGILLANPSVYKMLWRYTDKFSNAKNAARIFKEVGLHTNYESYFYGCATGFHGNK